LEKHEWEQVENVKVKALETALCLLMNNSFAYPFSTFGQKQGRFGFNIAQSLK